MTTTLLSATACGDTWGPCGDTWGQRAVTGGAIGAGSDAAIGSVTGIGILPGAIVGGAVSAGVGRCGDARTWNPMMRLIASRMMTAGVAVVVLVATSPAVLAQSDASFNRRCYGTGNPDQTIEACTSVIAGGSVDRKDLGAAFKLRGNAHADKGEYDSAIDDYGHAIAIDPGRAGVFNDRGASRGAKGQYELSILDYDRALALKPESAMALSNRCFAKAVMDRLAEALVDCNESLRLRPGNPNSLASRGFVHLKLGDSKSAIADYDAEIKVDPGNPYSLFGRGIGKRLAGDPAGGDADIAAATTIDAGIAEAMAKVGVRP
jgi:tetratricopeptide (TPR) repeat protein